MRSAAAVFVVAAFALTGCGSGDKPENAATTQLPPPASAFPKGGGKSLKDLVSAYPEGPILATTVSEIEAHRTNRIAFAAFDVAKKQVKGAAIAVYLLRGPGGTDARGPYPATPESLDVDAQYRSRQTAADLNSNDSIYVANVPVPKKGRYVIAGVAKLGGKTYRTSQFAITAGRAGGPPDVGDPAPKVKTLTSDDVAGDLKRIDTRQPPLAQLHAISAGDAIGSKPTVLLFATPQLCQSRVCGPVDDVMFEVSANPENKGVDFIHQEIYNNNTISEGLQAPVRAYRLSTEPWAFIIDRTGVVRERLEGAFSATELQAAVDKIR